MPAKLKVWILTLALLGLVVPRLIGADALLWYTMAGGGGGPGGNVGGAVNLPGGRSGISIAENTLYDVGYKLPIPETLTLNLPSNMTSAMAILTKQGVPLSFTAVGGAVIIHGEDLRLVRDAGITSFGFTLVSPENTYLSLLIELEPNSPDMKLLVQ